METSSIHDPKESAWQRRITRRGFIVGGTSIFAATFLDKKPTIQAEEPQPKDPIEQAIIAGFSGLFDEIFEAGLRLFPKSDEYNSEESDGEFSFRTREGGTMYLSKGRTTEEINQTTGEATNHGVLREYRIVRIEKFSVPKPHAFQYSYSYTYEVWENAKSQLTKHESLIDPDGNLCFESTNISPIVPFDLYNLGDRIDKDFKAAVRDRMPVGKQSFADQEYKY